jgi:hypothetical protein
MRRSCLLLLALSLPASAQEIVSTPQACRQAAAKFLGTLSPEQKAKAAFAFDDKERLNWHYIPLEDKATKTSTRKGLPLEAMNEAQKAAAMALLQSGLSESGFAKAKVILAYETLLAEHEKGSSWTRNPGWYFVSVFGTPGESGQWGWKIEGHHLALNYTFDGDKLASATPAFMGTNPAIVMEGANKGFRNLEAEEQLARDLFNSLDAEQQKVALQAKHFPQIEGQNPVMKTGEPVGLAAAKMTKAQRETLMKLIAAYAARLPADVAKAEVAQVVAGGEEKIVFGYSGGNKQGQPHTYRVQGPTFLIDFNCEQDDALKNPGNHIHSVYRNLKKDFALDSVGKK